MECKPDREKGELFLEMFTAETQARSSLMPLLLLPQSPLPWATASWKSAKHTPQIRLLTPDIYQGLWPTKLVFK